MAGLRWHGGDSIMHASHVTSDKYSATRFLMLHKKFRATRAILVLHKGYTKFIVPAGIMSSAQSGHPLIIRGFIRIIRNPFIPNPDDPKSVMTGFRIEQISPEHTSSMMAVDSCFCFPCFQEYPFLYIYLIPF